jgi:hypothetical protein
MEWLRNNEADSGFGAPRFAVARTPFRPSVHLCTTIKPYCTDAQHSNI